MIANKSYMAEEKDNLINDENLLFNKMLADLPGLNSKIQRLPVLVNEAFFGSYNFYKVMVEKTDELLNILQSEVQQNGNKAQEFLKSLSKIKLICDKIAFALQYQDIIEQKLQHILLIQKNTYERLCGEINRNDIESQKLQSQIACILLEINSAQLSDIVCEYEKAFEHISECVSSLKEEVKKINLIITNAYPLNDLLPDRALSDIAFEQFKIFKIKSQSASTSFVVASRDIIDFCHSLPKIDKLHFEKLPAIKEIKNLYTTESERRIFNKILFGPGSGRVDSLNKDIELF